MTLRLRAARDTDAGKLGAILTTCNAARDWMPRLHTGAEDIGFCGRMIDRFWVAVAMDDDDTPVGFITCDGAELEALYIHPDHQRRGYGTALLRAAQDHSAKLELWTHQANLQAQAFYVKHGFTEVRRTDGATNEEKLPDIRYMWQRSAKAPK